MEAEVLEEGSNLNVSTHPSFFGSNVWWGSYTLWLNEVFGYFRHIKVLPPLSSYFKNKLD